MKKIISLSLVLMMLLTMIAACSDTSGGNDNTDETTTTSAGETEPDVDIYDPGLPDENFEGRTFTILTKSVDTYTDWGERSIYTESENGEIVNDSIYQRNRYVEEMYNIIIKEYQSGSVVADITNSVAAGDGAYDVVMPAFGDCGTLASGGNFIDLYSMNYVNFDQPWWDQRSVEDLSIAKKLYFVSSDISTLNNDATWCTMFNKELIDDYDLESPYDLVEKNEWTYENYYSMYAVTYSDIDGDGQAGAYDRYPNLTQNENYNAMFIGGGERLITKDENDIPTIAIGQSERSVGVVEILGKIMNDGEFSLNYHNYGNLGYHLWTTQMFEESRGLFWITNLQIVIRLRDLETAFGIVPVPKYSSSQENYSNVVWTVGSYVAVPKTTNDVDCTGFILEALAAKSMELLRPAYYDVALNGKYLRDEESIDMLDIIIGERVYDLGLAFDFGGVTGIVQSVITSGGTDLISRVTASEKVINASITKVVDAFEKNA